MSIEIESDGEEGLSQKTLQMDKLVDESRDHDDDEPRDHDDDEPRESSVQWPVQSSSSSHAVQSQCPVACAKPVSSGLCKEPVPCDPDDAKETLMDMAMVLTANVRDIERNKFTQEFINNVDDFVCRCTMKASAASEIKTNDLEYTELQTTYLELKDIADRLVPNPSKKIKAQDNDYDLD